ncbi:MAG: hypothetical protein ACXVI3_03765 [Halobacteriota archaeon]
MKKLAVVGVMAIALVLMVSVCGCLQQTSTPSNQSTIQERINNVTEKISNVTTRIGNLTTRIGNLTQGNGSVALVNIGPLSLTV